MWFQPSRLDIWFQRFSLRKASSLAYIQFSRLFSKRKAGDIAPARKHIHRHSCICKILKMYLRKVVILRGQGAKGAPLVGENQCFGNSEVPTNFKKTSLLRLMVPINRIGTYKFQKDQPFLRHMVPINRIFFKPLIFEIFQSS